MNPTSAGEKTCIYGTQSFDFVKFQIETNLGAKETVSLTTNCVISLESNEYLAAIIATNENRKKACFFKLQKQQKQGKVEFDLDDSKVWMSPLYLQEKGFTCTYCHTPRLWLKTPYLMSRTIEKHFNRSCLDNSTYFLSFDSWNFTILKM